MSLYQCSEPGCPGHDTFSARCPRVISEYAPLTRFLKMLGATTPVDAPLPPIPFEERPARKADTRQTAEVPTARKPEVPSDARAASEAPTVEVAAAGKSSSKDYITFWRE